MRRPERRSEALFRVSSSIKRDIWRERKRASEGVLRIVVHLIDGGGGAASASEREKAFYSSVLATPTRHSIFLE